MTAARRPVHQASYPLWVGIRLWASCRELRAAALCGRDVNDQGAIEIHQGVRVGQLPT